jgi:hypothetical protein
VPTRSRMHVCACRARDHKCDEPTEIRTVGWRCCFAAAAGRSRCAGPCETDTLPNGHDFDRVGASDSRKRPIARNRPLGAHERTRGGHGCPIGGSGRPEAASVRVRHWQWHWGACPAKRVRARASEVVGLVPAPAAQLEGRGLWPTNSLAPVAVALQRSDVCGACHPQACRGGQACVGARCDALRGASCLGAMGWLAT